MTEVLSKSAGTLSQPPPTQPTPPSQEDLLTVAVRSARLALGWTQRDLASASGVSEVTIARLETAAISPRLATLSKLLSALQSAGITLNLQDPTGTLTITLTPAAVNDARTRLASNRH